MDFLFAFEISIKFCIFDTLILRTFWHLLGGVSDSGDFLKILVLRLSSGRYTDKSTFCGVRYTTKLQLCRVRCTAEFTFLQISLQLFGKILNCQKESPIGLEEAIWWESQHSQIFWHCPCKQLFRTKAGFTWMLWGSCTCLETFCIRKGKRRCDLFQWFLLLFSSGYVAKRREEHWTPLAIVCGLLAVGLQMVPTAMMTSNHR